MEIKYIGITQKEKNGSQYDLRSPLVSIRIGLYWLMSVRSHSYFFSGSPKMTTPAEPRWFN